MSWCTVRWEPGESTWRAFRLPRRRDSAGWTGAGLVVSETPAGVAPQLQVQPFAPVRPPRRIPLSKFNCALMPEAFGQAWEVDSDSRGVCIWCVVVSDSGSPLCLKL